jgi:hypothetical protein
MSSRRLFDYTARSTHLRVDGVAVISPRRSGLDPGPFGVVMLAGSVPLLSQLSKSSFPVQAVFTT